jgi:hypothetical protein
MTIPISELQDAVRKQLDEFAEQLTVDESLTPVSIMHAVKKGLGFLSFCSIFRSSKSLNLKMRSLR